MTFSQTLSNLRIADVELFVSAALFKNLGKAARSHHLSQSAASAAIQRVETACGFEVCTHEKRQFRLTKEGEVLLPHVEIWLRQLREIVSRQGAQLLPLRIATTHAIARVYIPHILSIETIDLTIARPDVAYGALLRNEVDIALVLDNAKWEGVTICDVAHGPFQLYSSGQDDRQPRPVLLPEDQLEVLTLQQRWLQAYGRSLPVKARIPSWSLITDICAQSAEVGFLPDFLAQQANLTAVPWQPPPSSYRILALYKDTSTSFHNRFQTLLTEWISIGNGARKAR